MPLEPLSNSLGGWSSKREFGRRLAAATVITAANELAAGRFRAVTFRAGVLTVAVQSGSARYLLQPEIPSLLVTLNKQLGHAVVRRIKFRLASDE